MNKNFFVVILLILLISSCATTHELEQDEIDEFLDYATEEMLMESEAGPDFDFGMYRNRLTDNYAVLQNSIPKAFQDVRNREERRNTNSGFRVQILSTPNIEVADSVQREFIIWIDSHDLDLNAETYVTFRQPNYRVHVGDFLDRNEAIRFSQVVRQRFPNAWVVHDRINPDMLQNGNNANQVQPNSPSDQMNLNVTKEGENDQKEDRDSAPPVDM